jgi:RNA polymerase sigma-70 factor, ECF subfamily
MSALKRSRDSLDDDAALVEAARAGDRGAFTLLFRRHVDRVRTQLTRLVGLVPERDDLVQQIFLSLYRALPDYRADAALTTFLHRITVNAAYDHLRTRRRRTVEPMSHEDVDALLGDTLDPRPRAEARSELVRMFQLLDRLPAVKRIAFVMVAVEGMTLADAAALIGAEEDTVKQRVLSARRELAARIAKEQRHG